VLNPKGLAFFLAFLPQFMVADAPVAPQVAILTATFVGVAAITNSGYAILAGSIRERLRNPTVLRWINRVGGGFMIAAGALTATMRRVS
jgi:threonine/homoserine/homoserine lactone efflux protein